MSGQLRQPQLEEVPEDGHVHGEASEVVGEVALGQDAFDHEDHHLVDDKFTTLQKNIYMEEIK